MKTMKIAVILLICRLAAGNAVAAKYNETLIIPPNGSVSAGFSLLPDEDAALTFVPGDAPKGYCYDGMTIDLNQKEGFCWVGSFYIINTEYKSAAATVTATCTWIPCGEGGGGAGAPPPPITGTGIGTAVAQPGTYWNDSEGNNVLALGGSAEVFAFKDDGEFADSTWSHSAKLSFKEENLISVKTVGEAASDSAWDSKVHSVSHDYPDLSDDEPFTVVSVFSIEAEPEVVCVGHEHIAYTITTKPEGFNHMVSYTPANTDEPGVHDVVATCGSSSATTTVTVIKVDTETVATAPVDKTRKKVGVGEEVELTLQPLSLSPVTWSISGNGALSATTGSPVTFTAHDRASTPTITASYGAGSCSVTFNVVEPIGAIIEQESGTGVWHVQGQASVGFKGRPYIQPDDVSFRNIAIREGSCAGVGTGYFLPDNGQNHTPGTWPGVSVDDPVPGKGSIVNGVDTISTGPHTTTPYTDGTFTWPIPWYFRVGTGAEKQFTTVNHQETINAAGDMSISKGGTTKSAALNDPSSNY